MERKNRPVPFELIQNEELNPRHFYAVYAFENAETRQPQITQLVHKAWQMGYPVRYWWLSEVADLNGNQDRLIIGVHHPSEAIDAGLELCAALADEHGSFWDSWDRVDAREYTAFGLPVEDIATISKPDETPLFPDSKSSTIGGDDDGL